MSDLAAILAPSAHDDEDVHWALSTAAALWHSGSHADALRWVRRAAVSATEKKQDNRAWELLSAIAELELDESLASSDSYEAAVPSGARDTRTDDSVGFRSLRSAVPTHVGTYPPPPPPRARDRRQPDDDTRRMHRGVTRASLPVVRPPPRRNGEALDPIRTRSTLASIPRAGAAAYALAEPVRLHDQVPSSASGLHVAPAGSPSDAPPRPHSEPPPYALAAFRVAIVPVESARSVRVLVLRAGEDAPVGAATAMLVPAGTEDAETIASIMRMISKD